MMHGILNGPEYIDMSLQIADGILGIFFKVSLYGKITSGAVV